MMVSFITPTHNHEKYIQKCIESVLSQTYPDVEQIIVDDGSTDRTEEIARSYQSEKIRYFRQENIGISRLAETYNFAVSQAKGEIIAILEGDDYALPGRAAAHVKAFEDPGVDVSWGITERWKGKLFLGIVPANPKEFIDIPHPAFTKLMLTGCYPAANTSAIRRSALDRIGGFLQGEYYVDYPTWLALLPNSKFHFTPEVLAVWGVHEDSFSTVMGSGARPDQDALRAYEKYPKDLKDLITPRQIYLSWHESYEKAKLMRLFEKTVRRKPGSKLTKRVKPFWTAQAILLYRMRSTYAVPTSLGVAVTPYCNIKCKYCMRGEFTPPGKPMSLETLQYILSRMPYIGDICFMGLCEPFLNPELPSMIKWLKSEGYRIALTTNGTIPIKNPEILESVDDFVISIDTSDPETFTYLRGGAQLDKVMENVNRIFEYKRSHNLGRCDNPPFHVNSVITRQNIDQMPGLFKMLEPYADDLTYVMVDPVSRPDYQKFEKPLALTKDEYTDKLKAVHQIATQSKLNIIGFDYMLKPSYRWDRCALSWWDMFIEPNGDAYFCYDYRRVLGNVLSDNPLKVWNSPVARDFRKQLLSENPPLDQCRSCNFARGGWQPSGEYLSKQGKIKKDVIGMPE